MRILIIEDDKKISAGLKKGLAAETYAVDLSPNGEEGERLAKVNSYDAIILDIMLPKQDGLTTCENLRRSGVNTPILMLTALGEVTDKIKGLDYGADDYLTKPFHFGELLARLRVIIRRNSEVKSSKISIYGIELDTSTHLAYRKGKEIKLSSKEFSLLELFMMNPGKILSREFISEHIWDMNFDPKSNVIESFIKFLRQKIDKEFDKPLIHTVRGSGYIFSQREY